MSAANGRGPGLAEALDLTAEERRLILALRRAEVRPAPWLVATALWCAATQRMASERHPQRYTLEFTGVGAPRLEAHSPRGRPQLPAGEWE